VSPSRPGGGPGLSRAAPVRALTGLLALAALLAPVLVPVLGAGSWSAPARAAAEDPTLTLTGVSPAVLAPTTPLTVTAVVRAGDVAVPAGASVEVRVQRSLLSTRSAVAAWSEQDDDGAVGSLLARVPLPDGLPAGASLPVQLDVAAGGTGLSSSPRLWGPRGLSVVLRSPRSERLAVVRSHVVWYPVEGELPGEPLAVTVVVPVTGPAPDPATGAPALDELTRLVRPGGRLDHVLTAAARPGAVLALDPAVVDPVVAAAEGPDADGTSGGAAPTLPPGDPGAGSDATGLGTWTERVRAVVADHQSLLLDYGDPDLAALAHADQDALARLADARADDVAASVLGDAGTLLRTVGWPVGGVADAETIDLLLATGRTSVLLDQSAQSLDDDGLTPDARAQVGAAGASVPSLLSDGGLGAQLSTVGDTGATGVQRLLAETAVIALERPSERRNVLVAAPRDWDPGSSGAAAVDALLAVPWTDPTSADELVASPAPERPRGDPTVAGEDRGDELDEQGLTRLGASLTLSASLASAFADPAAVTDPVERSAVALASAHWRGREQAWARHVDAVEAGVQATRGSVAVVPGSTLTQVSRNVRLPVAVRNDGPQDAVVRVEVVPRSSRLVVTEQVEVRVPAGGTEVGYVPVRGVGNGDTSVEITVRSPDGAVLGTPVQTRVLVRADWETWGTAGVGVVALLLLVAGVLRSWRRGRRRRGRDPVLDTDAAEADRTTTTARAGRPAGGTAPRTS
jgi:hypothetical protein